jgi:hypothetical protein
MRSYSETFTALFAAGVLVIGCQPSNDQVPDAVPPGAIPAAPDVRPGAEPEPSGTMSTGAEGTDWVQEVPADTFHADTTAGVDTVGMRRP